MFMRHRKIEAVFLIALTVIGVCIGLSIAFAIVTFGLSLI